jgi:AmiR/NasT family two-component response regulator
VDFAVRQVSTDVATIESLQERAIRRGDSPAVQLRTELNDQVAIEQAKGVVAERRGVTVDEAYELLRAYAHRRRRPLPEVVAEVVSHGGQAPMRQHPVPDDLMG